MILNVVGNPLRRRQSPFLSDWFARRRNTSRLLETCLFEMSGRLSACMLR